MIRRTIPPIKGTRWRFEPGTYKYNAAGRQALKNVAIRLIHPP
jgi:hypothetical protein